MKFYLDAYGCTMNSGEAYALSRRLEGWGHQRVATLEEADTVLLFTCIVIQPTENRMWKLIRKYRGMGKHVILCGCLSSIVKDELDGMDGITVVRIQEYPEIERVIAPQMPYTDRFRIEGITHIIPIAQGCMGRCSYCITRVVRPGLKSVSPETIIKDAEQALRHGAKEIYLTAQDTAVYGRDIGTDISSLVQRVTGLPREFRVRIGMMNPAYAYPIREKLWKVYAEPKVYTFLHLPVQSGSDPVLMRMNRGYTVKEFIELVDEYRTRFDGKDSMLSTDIIVGFPGEGNDDFEGTLSVLRRSEPDIVNVTRYSPRPGTPSFNWRGPHGRIVKDRSRRVTRLRFEIGKKRNERLIGEEFSALVTEQGKEGWVCRTDAYRPIVVKERVKLGERVKVRVTGATGIYLIGELNREC